MYFLKIIYLVLFQTATIQSGFANNFLNGYETQLEKSLNNKYFIIVNNDDNNKKYNVIDANEKGKYYLIFDNDSKPVQRRFRDLKKDREERKQAQLVKTQHANKMKAITDFMQNHLLTTNYLYKEVQRIKRQRKVTDDLRRMVEYLEKPEKRALKAQIMKCYYEARKNEILSPDLWGQNTNNLVINVAKDPENYGYIN